MLEEKIVTLTEEIVKLRQALEKGGSPAAAGGDKAAAAPAKPKTAAAKPKKVEPKHDQDEVGAIMRQASKLSAEDKASVRSHIADNDCADLAELLTKPELFDAAYDFAEALIEASTPAEDDDEV